MKIFVFESLSKVSSYYHRGGGLVIIAKDLDHAKEVVSVDTSIILNDEEWNSADVFELADNVEPKFWVMPDAGCC